MGHGGENSGETWSGGGGVGESSSSSEAAARRPQPQSQPQRPGSDSAEGGAGVARARPFGGTASRRSSGDSKPKNRVKGRRADQNRRRSSSPSDLSRDGASREGGGLRSSGSGSAKGPRLRSGSQSSDHGGDKMGGRRSGSSSSAAAAASASKPLRRTSGSADSRGGADAARRRERKGADRPRRKGGEGSAERLRDLDSTGRRPAARRADSCESSRSSKSGGSAGFDGAAAFAIKKVEFDRNDDGGRLVRNISLVRETSTSNPPNGTQEQTVNIVLKTGRDASLGGTADSGIVAVGASSSAAPTLVGVAGGGAKGLRDPRMFASTGSSASTLLAANVAAAAAAAEGEGRRGAGALSPTPRSSSSLGSGSEADTQADQQGGGGGRTSGGGYSPMGGDAVDLSTRSAPPPQQLHRDTTMTTVGSERSWDMVPSSGELVNGADQSGHSVDVDLDFAEGEEFDPMSSTRSDSSVLCKRRKVALLIDQCESARFPFRKKLILANMGLTAQDIPADDICSHGLCHSLSKLSLAGNRLNHVPDKIVMKLAGLKTLDLSQCDLHRLPRRWNLPHLKRLDLSHNRIDEFPSEHICEGLPELQMLDMSGNKVVEIVVPRDLRTLSRLDHVNLGYNRIRRIPSDLDRLTSLRTLRVMNNNIEKVPERVCEMDLRVIDVSSNPLVQPPVETCERGIGSMRRYYHCLRLEEKSRQKMIDEMHRKAEMKKKSQRGCSVSSKSSKWRSGIKNTPLLSLTRRGKSSRVSDQAFAATSCGGGLSGAGGDTDQDDSTSSGATAPMSGSGSQHHPSALGPSDRARSEPASSFKPAASEKPPEKSARAKTVPATKVEQSVKRVDSVNTGSTRRRTPARADEGLTSAGHAGAFSDDRPTEKRFIVSASAVKVSKPFEDDTAAAVASSHVENDDSSASLDGPAAIAAKPPPPPPPKDIDLTLALNSSAPSVVSAGSVNSDIDEAQLDAELLAAEDELVRDLASDTINDTLKVIFVGMACAGKTSMIKRLIEGRDAKIPKQEERTVGVDIYEWDPKNDGNDDRGHINTWIADSAAGRGFGSSSDGGSFGDDVDVKFSVWDFAGQHVYHATHELFFSPRALYVLVWDMGVSNVETQRQNYDREEEQGAFKLSYESDDENEDGDFTSPDDDEGRRADRALERDIDEKVQFWVDCIQSSAPGAAILPVASFDDFFEGENGADDGALGADEARRRCDMMKQRLQKHEARRVRGLEQRLADYEQGHRANSEAALRLRQLLCPFSRPKLIFGENLEDSVVRVSCTKYRGFGRLAEKIVNIATGRERGNFDYPIFHGHIGARIPRMRLEVREAVRTMRDRFKVVEWGYFLDTLRRERGLDNAEDVSDALHFLTNIGELSYFGDVVKDRNIGGSMRSSESDELYDAERGVDDEEDEDYEEEEAVFVMDKDSNGKGTEGINDIARVSESSREQDMLMSYGLSQFIFLNPRWLVAAVACILRHDLTREINETRRQFNKEALVGWDNGILRGDSFYEAHLNCPVITAEDACMLWQAKKITKKAAERAQEYSNDMTITPFEFLQRLLIRFRVFVPIDLSIDKALLGGKEYGLNGENPQSEGRILDESSALEDSPQFFFLPSLLGPGEPAEAWTYKNSDSWKTTLCHSILFPDGVPPGLMERITATVLSDVYGATQERDGPDVVLQPSLSAPSPQSMSRESCVFATMPVGGRLSVKEILCWRSAFFLKMGMENVDSTTGEVRESTVEMFCALVDRDSHLCVGSDFMGVGMRRLILSGKGQVGEGGRKIWQGGYTLVIKAIGRVMEEYGGLEFEKQGICPECIAKRPVSKASVWDWTLIRSAAKKGDESIRCHFGHPVGTRLVTGLCCAKRPVPRRSSVEQSMALPSVDSSVPVSQLLRAVVVVGLWDGKTEKIVRVGSGFVVDRKRGLIVTASHTLMNIWGDSKSPYGENYYGLRSGKVVIGVIPKERSADSPDNTTAVFRYFAQIVAKDPSIEANGVCHMDACVLQITTKMEQDVGGDGDDCGTQPEILIQNDPAAFKKEKLHHLKVASKECELDEQVRIMGYNQGGEGLIEPGSHVNRCADFAKGYVCMKFHTDVEEGWSKSRRFKPTEEVVVICPTIGGHSGGPCVNQSGEVIGILSRADPTERQRCYLVPSTAWKGLLKKAKASSPY